MKISQHHVPHDSYARDFAWNRGCSSNSPPLTHGDQIPYPLEDSDNQFPPPRDGKGFKCPQYARGGGECWSFDLTVASHAGVFRGACIFSLVERDEIRALLKTPAWEANLTDTLHITTHHYPSLHITTLWQQWNKWKYKFCKWLGRNRKFVRWWNLRKTDHSKRNPRTYIET